MNIIETTNRTDSLTKQLLEVWESAVRQTHTFLSESEILRIKGYVPDVSLVCWFLWMTLTNPLPSWGLKEIELKCCLWMQAIADKALANNR